MLVNTGPGHRKRSTCIWDCSDMVKTQAASFESGLLIEIKSFKISLWSDFSETSNPLSSIDKFNEGQA